MKLFWKIFASIFFSFVVTVSLISYVITIRQIATVEEDIIENTKILGSFLSKEIEVGYFENKWPFESLKKLSNHKGILFWWIVRDDGTIHLADDASFMETYANDYFPEMAHRLEKENISLKRDQNYGIFSSTLETGPKKWSFLFGFSLNRATERKKEIIFLITAISVSSLIVLGFILYIAIKYFTEPLKELTLSAEHIGKGDLSHRVRIKSKDELGQLAQSFNKMTDDLQKTMVSKDYVDNIIESMVDALIVVDPNGKILTVNKAICELSGHQEKELLGNSIETIFPETEEIYFKEKILEKLAKEDELRNYETYLQTKDGKKISLLFNGSVVKDKDGRMIRIVCTARDITDLKRIEKEREKLIKELQKALAEIKQLSGLLPICSGCKKIRDDKGYWNQIEEYISDHSEAIFSHGLCPECLKKLYSDI
jgi:PAS domain S-box-containing protein